MTNSSFRLKLEKLRRFGFDAAVLFSDILVVPHALGQRVTFAQGEGPQLDPLGEPSALSGLRSDVDHNALEPVYATIARVKQDLPRTVHRRSNNACGLAVSDLAVLLIEINARIRTLTCTLAVRYAVIALQSSPMVLAATAIGIVINQPVSAAEISCAQSRGVLHCEPAVLAPAIRGASTGNAKLVLEAVF
jgi:uroporphyrinogen-III decarboxylase